MSLRQFGVLLYILLRAFEVPSFHEKRYTNRHSLTSLLTTNTVY